MDAESSMMPTTGETLGGVLARIRAVAASLPDSERTVAEFITAHPTDVIQSPISDLAVMLGVSTTTIIRCARSLGFSGLRELKYSLAVDAAAHMPAMSNTISGNDRAIDIARNVLTSDIQAISDTIAILDNATLENAVRTLIAARKIEFFAAGASAPVATDGYLRFLRSGMPATIVTDPYTQAISAQRMRPGDVAFAVSRTGRTMSVVDALGIARENGAATIVLTSFARSPMTQLADITILTAAHQRTLSEAAMNSRITLLSVLDALLVACVLRRDGTISLLARSEQLPAGHHELPDDDPATT